MLLKSRKKPLMLDKLDALLSRLPLNYHCLNELEGERARIHKGYIGEKKVDYFIEKYFSSNYIILQDVCLKIEGSSVQMDMILITPHAIFIIECKNYNGTIIFNTNLNQFTRDNGKVETGYRHPIAQAETQQLKLTNWLIEHHFQHVPVYFFIAISNPSTVIKVIGDESEIAKNVGHGEYIPKKIMEIEAGLSKEESIRLNDREISTAILQECQDYDINIIQKYGVRWKDIMPGVHCPKCGYLGMDRRHSNWYCLKCDHKSRHAHLKALKDYFILIKSSISNKECRWFLQLSSRSIATRILQGSDLIYRNKRWYKE